MYLITGFYFSITERKGPLPEFVILSVILTSIASSRGFPLSWLLACILYISFHYLGFWPVYFISPFIILAFGLYSLYLLSLSWLLAFILNISLYLGCWPPYFVSCFVFYLLTFILHSLFPLSWLLASILPIPSHLSGLLASILTIPSTLSWLLDFIL